MELVLSLGIGVFAAAGIWLILRPRTFQVVLGLSLLSYAINLFIFAMGRLTVGAPPVLGSGPDVVSVDDPVPQALVLTAVVISFALSALFLVVLLAARGVTGSDHVDGQEPHRAVPHPGRPQP
jgi:multicomponent K+:H+ antiporter subunit C